MQIILSRSSRLKRKEGNTLQTVFKSNKDVFNLDRDVQF